MSKFRWSTDGGSTWAYVDQALPYTIPGVTDAQAILVEPIGADAVALGLSAKTFSAGAAAGTVIGNIGGVPTGAAATFTPTNGGDTGKVTTAGTGATAKLVVGLAASAIGSMLGTISAPGVASLPVTVTVGSATQTLAPDSDLAFAYGGSRLISGYNGPLATACAASAPDTPTTTIQIFAGDDGKADESAAVTAFGYPYHIWKWHDQTGQAGDLTGFSTGSRQERTSGFPSFPFNSYNDFNKSYGASSPNYERSAFSLFEVVAGSMQGANSEVTANIGASWDVGFSVLCEDTGRGVLTAGPGFARGSIYHGTRPTVCSSVLATSGIKIRTDDQRQTLGGGGATPSATMSGVIWGAGWQPKSGTNSIALVGYKRAVSDADEAAISARLTAIFGISVKTAYILGDGDSIQRGQGAYTSQNKWGWLNDSLPAHVHMINAGHPGASQQARDLGFFAARRIVGRSQVWMQNWGSNDFAAGASAATVFGTDNSTGTRFNIASAIAGGFIPVIETVIQRADLTAPQNSQRQAFNQLLRDNAAPLGFRVIDYGDTVYPTVDGVHPTGAGYQAMAAIAAPVLIAALA